MITVQCDNCDKAFQVQNDSAGQKVSCPYCSDVSRVPGNVSSHAYTTPTAAAARRNTKAVKPESESEQHITVVRQPMFRAHPFWYIALVLTLLAGCSTLLLAMRRDELPGWLQWVGAGLALFALLWWLVWWAAPKRWTKLIITNKRTIRQEGIVIRRTSEVLHEHIRNVKIDQTVVQRVLGVGDLSIDSAGGSEQGMIEIHMRCIPKPYQIKKLIDQFRGM